MKIVFFNRFFFPDTSATSQILSDLAFHLAQRGLEVHVVTTGGDGRVGEETIRGVRVHRVATGNTATHGLVPRAAAYARYYVGARRAALRLIAPGDVVVLKTDPPLLPAAMTALAKRRGAQVFIWLQDLFPEVAKAYGVRGLAGPVYALLRRMRDRALRKADGVVAISESIAQRLRTVVPAQRLHVIHNWAHGEELRPRADAGRDLRIQWDLRDAFVVAYSGNFGRVHEFDTILDAARVLQDQEDVVFTLIGRGPRLAAVKERAARLALRNVRFEDHQPRERLAETLGVADVHLTVLDPRFEGLVHPSKLYGVMAAGRPTLFVGDVTGETARILRESDSGSAVATGEASGLAAQILRLRDAPAEVKRLGDNARRAFEERYDLPLAMARWEALLAR